MLKKFQLSNLQLNNVFRHILVTLVIIVIYILGMNIPIPFARVTHSYVHLLTTTPISWASSFSGANIQTISLFSLGLMPMMIAVIVVQLMTMVNFLGIGGLSGYQLNVLNNFATFVIAALQATVMAVSMHLASGFFNVLSIIIVLTAGAMMVTWLGMENGAYGIGGTIVLILFNIIMSAGPMVVQSFKYVLRTRYAALWISLLIILVLAVMVFWVAFGHAYYPLYLVNVGMSSRDKPIMQPISLNGGAMMTYMLGLALLTLPMVLGNRFGRGTIFANIYFQALLSGVLAFGLFYFFSLMMYSPKNMARQYQHDNAYLIGIRPGRPTQLYLRQLIVPLLFPGALLNSVQMVLGLTGASFLASIRELQLSRCIQS